jgi:hypothetical protein
MIITSGIRCRRSFEKKEKKIFSAGYNEKRILKKRKRKISFSAQ